MMVSVTRVSVSACDAVWEVQLWVDPVVQVGEYQRFDFLRRDGSAPERV